MRPRRLLGYRGFCSSYVATRGPRTFRFEVGDLIDPHIKLIRKEPSKNEREFLFEDLPAGKVVQVMVDFSRKIMAESCVVYDFVRPAAMNLDSDSVCSPEPLVSVVRE
jgi:hypothetical protein